MSKWTYVALCFTVLLALCFSAEEGGVAVLTGPNRAGGSFAVTVAAAALSVFAGIIALYWISWADDSIGPGCMSNIWNASDTNVFINIRLWQLAIPCTISLMMTGAFAGWLSTGDEFYAKLLDDKPLAEGQTMWVFPLQFGRVRVIDKVQNIYLAELHAETSDGILVTGNLYYEGVLTADGSQWIGFKGRREQFIKQLEAAYATAIGNTSLAKLEHPLLVSATIEAQIRTGIQGGAIVSRPGGTVSASGFKILQRN